MDLLHALTTSLLSPMVLAFGLGLVAALLRSDLKIPEPLYAALTIYLLFAIGLKGGAKLDGVALADFTRPLAAGLGLCLAIPVSSYAILRRLGRLDATNAGAVAAHYGSVSVVTFGACLAFLDSRAVEYEPFLPALLAVMEVPAILVALYLVRRAESEPAEALHPNPAALNIVRAPATGNWARVLHELLTSKGIVLLLGGMVIGLLSGRKGFDQVAPLFDVPFKGMLTLFLLEMGLVTGRRLGDLKTVGPFLCGFAIVMPFLHGLLGVALGRWADLGVAGPRHWVPWRQALPISRRLRRSALLCRRQSGLLPDRVACHYVSVQRGGGYPALFWICPLADRNGLMSRKVSTRRMTAANSLPMSELNGQVVLVTGASSGIGEATAPGWCGAG